MQVRFVARRFHSNQAELIEQLTATGIEVKFYAEYVGRSEVHETVVPIVIGNRRLPWPPFRVRQSFWSLYRFGTLATIVEGLSSGDLVIIRNFNISSLLLSIGARFHGARVVIYTQDSVARVPGLWKCLWRRLFSRYEITPACHAIESPPPGFQQCCRFGLRRIFLPFVMVPKCASDGPMRKADNDNASLRFLAIGKFSPRKKLVELAALVADLRAEGRDLSLTIAGAPLDREVKAALYALDEQHPWLTVIRDHPRAEMDELYTRHDVFVLPSIEEPAAVSHLEAMAHGLPVVVCSDNGTACYVKHEHSGLLFNSGKWEESLRANLLLLMEGTALRQQLADNAVACVRERHDVGAWLEFLRACPGGG